MRYDTIGLLKLLIGLLLLVSAIVLCYICIINQLIFIIMKTKFFLTLAAIVISLSLSAQTGQSQVRSAFNVEGPSQSRTGFNGQGQQRSSADYNKDRVAGMAEKLQLTEAQQKDLLAIFNESSKQMTEMRSNFSQGQQMSDTERQAMREKLTKSRAELDAKIEKVLGEEKYKQYQEMQKQRLNQGNNNRPARDSSARGTRPSRQKKTE